MVVKRAILLFFVLVGLVFSQDQDTEDLVKRAKAKGEVILNFQNTDIKELALFMGELLGKNVVVDPAVRSRMTLVFSKPLKIREAWDVFTSALFMQGYGVVEKKGMVNIMPLNEAITVAQIKKRPAKGELAILVYSFKYVDAQMTMNSIRPFLSPFARVSVHAQSNSLIIADIGENIRKAKLILKDLDKTDAEGEVRVYTLNYIDAKEAMKVISPLNPVFNKRFGTQMIVSASDSANALVIFAPRAGHEVISNILSKIDNEGVSTAQRSFYIIPLNFVSADEISDTLQSLLGGGGARRSSATTVRPKTQPRGGETKSKGGQGKKPKPNTPTKGGGQRKITGVITTKGGMKIGFDRGTNSVIVYGTKEEYEGLKDLISKLDTRRKQVLIAATVVEASTRNLLDIGIRWQALGKYGGASFKGSTMSEIYGAFSSGNFLLGTFSTSGKEINIGGTNFFFPDLALLFSLLETGSGFNIVSNPKVLTLDNQPALIKVGQVIPYAEGVKFDINGQPIITYDYKEVGLELNVTPHISGDNLRLTINLSLEEIIDFVTNEIGATSYTVPVTSNREVNSDVVIENGQTIILGGLVSTKTLKTIEGIPLLWRIPILGRLFRRDVKQDDKTTLFIFITPYVVSSPEELSRLTEEHKRISDEIIKRLKEKEEEEEDEHEVDM